MESIIAKALEYTLKYWLRSFARDQFKLQGRTAQLSNLDINGDAFHASAGLPPAFTVTTAKVGKLQIELPSVSNVQTEPIVVQVDKLDLVFEENPEVDVSSSTTSTQSSTPKGSSYGFADKISDGMTLEVHTVNLLIVTRGGPQGKGGSTWAAPMASITIHKLLLHTTNGNWEVVNLKEAREFSSNKGFIYVFRRLKWESLSIDLLPHPDMFTDATLGRTSEGENQRDDDGAKRVFFGGERFMEGISGEAYITIQRTEQNRPFGLEVQLHITEAVCPALSEPGLRALLRFMTGLYVCLNRGDVDLMAQQRSAEAAGLSLVSIVVDHIFLCIKDTEFQLELLMQSLFFSRATISAGDNENTLNKVMISGFFLRDTFTRPPCTLVQPSMQAVARDIKIPDFGKKFCPVIYPLEKQKWQVCERVPLITLHSLQAKPSPAPPSFATQTFIDCQPLEVYLQEESYLRIFSFLADGIVVVPGAIMPDSSVNSLEFVLKELYFTVPLDTNLVDEAAWNNYTIVEKSFSGARLHIGNLFFLDSASLKLKLLQLEKDPACFPLWEEQPLDASQKKWTAGASHLSLSLETCTGITGRQTSPELTSGTLRCVELKHTCIEVAMATLDGKPLGTVPPPGGIVRIGVACQEYLSNTSIEQLFFVLDLYGYFGRVSEKIASLGKKHKLKMTSRNESFSKMLTDKVPSDTAVSLLVKDTQLRFLDSSSKGVQELPLVQFVGTDLVVKVSHRTLGGAIAISSTVRWESIEVDCVDTEENTQDNGRKLIASETCKMSSGTGNRQLRAVLWVNNKRKQQLDANSSVAPLLDITMSHVIPFNEDDIESHSVSVSACVSGIRLGGGMNYSEALLHRFGIFGPDGGPGEGLLKGIKNLSAGPLSKLFRQSPLGINDQEEDRKSGDGKHSSLLHLGMPDEVDVSIELSNWLFALEVAQEMAEKQHADVEREDKCWHTTFEGLQLKAKSNPNDALNGEARLHRKQTYPIKLVTVSVEGLQALKPYASKNVLQEDLNSDGTKKATQLSGGINVEVCALMSGDNSDNEAAKWVVENIKFCVMQPIEAVVTNDELQQLAFLCKSEIDSVGRITAGVLRLLKLEKSLGQTAIDQLSNLGTSALGKIFSLEEPSRGQQSPSFKGRPDAKIKSTVASLEAAISESQSKCAALTSELGSSDSSNEKLDDVKQIMNKLESMQGLLTQLSTQI